MNNTMEIIMKKVNLGFLMASLMAVLMTSSAVRADVSAPQDNPVDQGAKDIGHGIKVGSEKTVLVIEKVGKDSYRYALLPAGRETEKGAKIVATDVRIGAEKTAQITIRTAEDTYYFVGNVSHEVYDRGIAPAIHVVDTGAKDIGHGIVQAARDVGHAFGAKDDAQDSSVDAVLDTDNGSVVVKSVEVQAPQD
jgi:hypothetical protein